MKLIYEIATGSVLDAVGACGGLNEKYALTGDIADLNPDNLPENISDGSGSSSLAD